MNEEMGVQRVPRGFQDLPVIRADRGAASGLALHSKSVHGMIREQFSPLQNQLA